MFRARVSSRRRRSCSASVPAQPASTRRSSGGAAIDVASAMVMLPTRGGLNSIMAAQVVDLAWPNEVPVSLVSVDDRGDAPDVRVLEDVLHLRPVERRLLTEPDPAEALLEEVRLGYGTAVIGCSAPEEGRLLPPIVEQLGLRTPVPLVVVRRGPDITSRLPPPSVRVLIAVSGTASSVASQEVGLAISASIGTEAVLTHIVHHDETPEEVGARARRPWAGIDVLSRSSDTAPAAGQTLPDDAVARASTVGARAVVSLTEAESTAAGILALADLHETDLVIVGATRRSVDGELFLGHTVERLLRRCRSTMVVVISPPGHEPTEH